MAAETITVPAQQSGNFNASLTIGAAPTRSGYTFDGWNTASSGSSGVSYAVGASFTVPASNTVLYARWTINNYTVTYDDNVAAETITVPAQQSGNFNTSLTIGAAPTRSGYTFAGWNTQANGQGTAYAVGASFTVPATNTVLYARWTINSYVVTYNANGGTGAPSSSTVQFGSTATVASSASNPSRTGHTFDRWTTVSDGTGSMYLPGATFTMGAGNVALFAKWTVNNYTVTYDDNVASETIGVPAQQSGNYATSVTVGSAPSRTGHTFAGWNTQANGQGTAYSAGASLTVPASNTVLYAQWNTNTYTVSYNLDGGSGTAPASQTAAFNSTVPVSNTTATRIGFTFAGWSSASGGQGTTYSVGDSYTVPATNSWLYARWTAVPYTVAFVANDDANNPATGLPANITNRNYQQSVTVPGMEPTRPSYVFNGWNTAANGSGTSYTASGTLTMPAANVTLYAQWVPASFGVVYNANGGSGAPAPTNNSFGSTVTISTTQPTRTGHTFRWWTTTLAGTGTTHRNPATGSSVTSFTMPGSQVTLYAQWEVDSYTVAYNANLGSNAPASQNVDYDSVVTASSNTPTRAGYQFLAWNTAANGSGTSYAPGGSFQMPAANVTLYAQWQAVTYSVTYNVNGGGSVAPATQSATTDSTVTVSSTLPTRAGYDFAGWNTSAGGTGSPRTPGGTFTMPTNHVTLYAQWNPQTLGISYSGNGGAGVPGAQTGVVDSSVTLSATVPTRTGYTFTGWNTAVNGSGVSRASGATFTMPTSAVVLYAQWQAIPYAINYGANNGSGAPNPTSHVYLDAVTLSATNPTRNGYWFNGWNTESDGSGTTHVAGGSLTMPASDVTLYAQWVANEYRVVYNANGGDDAPADQVLATDSSVTVSTTPPTRVGHTFDGWNTNADGTGTPRAAGATFAMPPSNTTLYAQWLVVSYPLTYAANGGTSNPVSIPYGTTVTVTSDVPTREGHTFLGWATSSNGSGSSYVAGNTFSMPAAALTLYAQWSANNYSVTYFANGGSSAPSAQSETFGTTVSVSATPATRAGYSFDYWTTQADGQGTRRDSGSSFTMPASNVVLYARWTAQSFNVTFNANGGSGAPSGASGATDSTVTLPSTIPTRSGYDFVGWNTLQAGTGTGYQPGSSFTMPPNNVVLWAQWQPRRFVLTYDVNGGATNPPVGIQALTDSSIQAASTTPSRVGYTFAGWNTAADGSGTATTGGSNFNMPPNDVTLYAQWTANTYAVVYDANGGTGGPGQLSGTTDSTVTVSNVVPSRVGYTFAGWNTAADGSGTARAVGGTFTMPAANVSLFAQWTLVPPAPVAPEVRELPAPAVEIVVSGRSVEIEPLAVEPPAGDAWDQSTMGLYRVGVAQAQETGNLRATGSLPARETRLETPGGVWTVDRAEGTVSFVADANFVGREQVGFAVTTRLGIEYQSTLTVDVTEVRPTLPVSGIEAARPLTWALWTIVVGLFVGGVRRTRTRRV